MTKRVYFMVNKKVFLTLFFLLLTVFAYSQNTNIKRVKAGFFALDGYHNIDENGNKSGYGYDFLRMTQKYININYDYIGYDKTWEEMQEMLLNGQIDVLTSAHRIHGQKKGFDYSIPIGTNTVNIIIRPEEERFVSGDYASYNGMTLGLIENSRYNSIIEKFAKDNFFTFKPKYYKNSKELLIALQLKEVDAIATNSLIVIKNEKILSKFNTEAFYAIVRKEDAELLKQINYAINQMNNIEGDWKTELYNKNFIKDIKGYTSFTKEEQEYIEKYSTGNQVLCIATDNNWSPFSWKTGEQFQGIIPDLIDSCMKMCGINYKFYQTKENICDISVLNNKEVNLYLGYSIVAGSESEVENLITSTPLFKSELAYLTRKDDMEIKSVALCNSTPYMNKYFLSIIDIPTVEYKDSNEARLAVLNKKVDAALLYIYDAEYIINQDNTKLLSMKLVPIAPIDIKASIREDENHILMSILIKCLNNLTEAEKLSIVSKYISYSISDTSILDYIIIHPLITIAILLAILILSFWTFYVHQSNKAEKTYRHELEKKVNKITSLNEQLQANQEHLENARKEADAANHAKTIFLNNMSHDMRTPMNAILGFANLMEKQTGNPEIISDYLQKIETSGGYLLSIINNVLDMASIDSGTVKLSEDFLDLEKNFYALPEQFESLISNKNLNLAKSISITHKHVLTDITRINQIFVNLLSNAIKYTPASGNISIDLKETTCSEEGSASYIFTISDTGIGMSHEFMSHIFESFSRERNSTESKIIGTGLGMSIVKRLADLMGGTIEVESEISKGSTFRFIFTSKLAQNPQDDSYESIEDKNTEINFAEKRILLTEDNDLNAEIATVILEDAGFIVERAEDGAICVDKMQKAESGFYDLILMDIQMPNMDGYTATRTIRAMADSSKSNIPIIAMTANAFEEDKKAAMEAGMNAHLAKPIDTGALMKELAALLG